MCFSAKQSFGFAALGASAAGILVYRRRSWKYVALVVYFTLMEVLQLAQYMVINRCDSKLNQLLTWLGFVHICLQPVVFNEFIWGQPQPVFNKPIISQQAHQIVHWTVRRLALAASGLLILKGTPAFLQLVGLSQSAGFQGLVGSTAAAYLTNAGAYCGGENPEMCCGRQLCSFYGKYHVGWSVPQLPHSYYIPTAFLHGFFFFVPALALGGLPQWILSLAALLTGPVLTEIILGGDAEARRYEWGSIWCMFSLGQVILLFVVELAGSKALFGRFHIPSVEDDLKPGSPFSDLLESSMLGSESARKRAAGKRSSIGGGAEPVEYGPSAADLVGSALRRLNVPASVPATLSEEAAGATGTGVEVLAGNSNDADGQLTPRRSARLQKRAIAGTKLQ